MIGLAIKAFAILALLAALAYGVHRYNEHYRDQGRAEVQAKWDADNVRRIALTTGIVMDATKRIQEADDVAATHKADRDRLFSAVEVAADSVRRGPGIRVPADVAGVLERAAVAANAERGAIAAADGRAEARADPVPGPSETAAVVYDERDLAIYLTEGPKAYADAYGLWRTCRTREDVCRADFNKLSGGAP